MLLCCEILLHITGFTYKFLCWEISNVMPKSLPLGKKTLQFANGFEAKRKGINVSTTNTSLFRTSEVLDAYEDVYDGVIVDPESLPSSANAFSAILQASISHWKLKVVYMFCLASQLLVCQCWQMTQIAIAWKLQGKKGIWLKILEEQADLVPIALRVSR